MTKETKSEKIINRIVKDLSDRRGLRQEWEKIDDDIKDEIKQVWREIVDDEIRKT